MDNCNCTRGGEMEKLNIVYKEVMGNGKEGLAKSSIRLQETVNTLTESTKALSTNVSGLHKFQTEIETAIRENEKFKSNKKWYIRTIIAVSSVAATFIGIYFANK